jgi:hypothetical protein
MKRPVGVTVIAVFSIVDVFTAFSLPAAYGLLPSVRASQIPFLALLILSVTVLVSVIFGVGLLRLKQWTRKIAIIFALIALLGTIDSGISAVLAGLRVVPVFRLAVALYSVWVVWYLSDSDVIAVFREREILTLRKSLVLRVSAIRFKVGARFGSAIQGTGSGFVHHIWT